jgi:hypothetical protein
VLQLEHVLSGSNYSKDTVVLGNRQHSWYSDLLQAGQSRGQTLVGQDFPDPSTLALKPTQPPVQWILGLFPRGKVAKAWHFLHKDACLAYNRITLPTAVLT